MNNRIKDNNKPLVLNTKFKTSADETSHETIESAEKLLNEASRMLKKFENKLEQSKTLEELNNIGDLGSVSSIIGNVYISVKDENLKHLLDRIESRYRNIEVAYFNKKIELLTSKSKQEYEKLTENIEETTGNTLFSIASVFLGISLTSALVTGVKYLDSGYYFILYFMTIVLIAILVIGLSSIMMRKIDKKSIIMLIIVVITSGLWIYTFHEVKDKIAINNNNVNDNSSNEREFNDAIEDNKVNNNDSNSNNVN